MNLSKRKEIPEEDLKAFHFLNEKTNYRYERKFTLPASHSLRSVEGLIKRNSSLFREIYSQRKVNNIYFDTYRYSNYFDNVLGVSDRKKMRIRWYGETFGEISKPVLEVKLKKGLVGDKWSYPLKPFLLDEHFTLQKIQEIFRQSDLPLTIGSPLKSMSPTLLNSYERKYYLSADNNYRITMDFNLRYYQIDSHKNSFKQQAYCDQNTIIELKYGLDHDPMASKISTQFPFRMDKNSKYVNGVNFLKRFPQ